MDGFLQTKWKLLNLVNDSEDYLPKLKGQDWLLEDLFQAADTCRCTPRSTSSRNLHTSLRNAILGPSWDKDKARVRILALGLEAGLLPASHAWPVFVERLAGTEEHLRDGQLPFSHSFVVPLLNCDDELADRFYKLQGPIVSTFSEDRTELSRILQQGMTRCQALIDDEGHEPPPQPLCLESDLDTILSEQEALIQKLFVQATKARIVHETSDGQHYPTDSQISQVRSANANRRAFYNEVRHRSKALLLLVFKDASPISTAWRSLERQCLGQSNSTDSTPCLLNERFPLSSKEIETWCGREATTAASLLNAQHIFCSIKLQRNDQFDATKDNFRKCAPPLLSQRALGRGSAGRVYAVKMAPGYSPANTDELAMKVVRPSDDTSGDEWDVMNRITSQIVQHTYIMKFYASMRTPTNLYIFLPKARCDLRQFMQDERNWPRAFSERKKLLRHFIGIAQALKYLHNDLHDEEFSQLICRHSDLRADNILVVDQADGLVFQITDFGISSIDAPKENKRVVDTNTMFTRSGENRTQDGFFHNCSNLPPEAKKTPNELLGESADVWAYGAVKCEFIAWMHGGSKGYESYVLQRRSEENARDPLSFATIAGEHMVKTCITEWFETLVNGTQHPSPEESQFYEGAWTLIKEKILVIDHKKRESMKEICDQLSRLLQGEQIVTQIGRLDTNLNKASSSHRDSTDSGKRKVSLSFWQRVKPATGFPTTPAVPDDFEQLFEAIKNGTEESFDRRLSRLAAKWSVEQLQSETVDGDGLLSWCFKYKRSNMVLKLLNKTHPGGARLAREDYVQLLHRAVKHGMSEVVQLCLDRDPACVNGRASWAGGSRWRTPLMTALEAGDVDITDKVLKCEPDLEEKDEEGAHVLHFAVQHAPVASTKRLLDRQPELVHIPDDAGMIPLHYCAQQSSMSSVEQAEVLLRWPYHDGPVSRNKMLDAVDNSARTPVYYPTNVKANKATRQMVTLLAKSDHRPNRPSLASTKLGRERDMYTRELKAQHRR